LIAELVGPLLKKQQQTHPANTAKSVAAAFLTHAAIDDGEVVPIGEILLDHVGRYRIIGPQVAKCLIRQHNAPAKRVVGAVALEHRHIGVRLAQFHRDREVETAGSTPQTSNAHTSPFLPANVRSTIVEAI
jgi:hypothetical protein